MASPSTVLTRGYGAWGTVNDVVTLGYGIGEAVVLVYGPMCSHASDVQLDGGTAGDVSLDGATAGGVFCE